MISIIACVGSDGSLGYKNELLFNIEEDMKFFRKTTEGQIVIMGRKTFESIISMRGKPLSNRINVLLTSDKSYKPKYGEFVFHDIESILKHCKTLNDDVDKKVFVCGGEQVYSQMLPHTNEVLLTIVNKHVEESDTSYPMALQDSLGFVPTVPIEESEEFYTEKYDAYYKFVRYIKKKVIESGEEHND